ncbi:MAG: efflux RND transporter permease subunit, partial [Planctomycetes bacterium]|nr:efflux RND transporter permease subunit [Planctomycetota bacterium]
VKPIPKPDEADNLANQATMDAVVKFDATMRELARRRQVEFMPELGEKLVRGALEDLVAFLQEKGELKAASGGPNLFGTGPQQVGDSGSPATGTVAPLSEKLSSIYGQRLADLPTLEDLTKLINEAVAGLAQAGLVEQKADLLLVEDRGLQKYIEPVRAVLGEEKQTLFERLFAKLEERRHALWKERVKILDWELFDRAPASLLWPLLEGLRDGARAANLLAREPSEEDLKALRAELEPPFAKSLFLWRKLKTDIVKEMDSELQFPGWGNIWTQPIINRVDMLATGVRTMIGVKVFGDDLNKIQQVSNEIADALRPIRGAVDVFPDQTVGENYLEVNIDREKAARYGINVGDIQDVVEVALGGKMITLTVEGRRRFPVRVRYGRDFREDEDAIKRILVSGQGIGMAGASEGGGEMGMGSAPTVMNAGGSPIQVPLSEVAEVKIVEGPTMIRSENGLLRAYVQLNVRDRDIVGFVEEAQRVVAEKVKLPSGMFIEWSGQFEHQVRAKKTLQVIFPMVILLIFVILYVTYHNLMDTLIMFLAVPGALAGGVLFQYLFGFNFSVAVWVGYIACFGLATETAIVMVIYLREAIDKRGGLENIKSEAEITEAVIEGAVHRLRPKLLTEGTTIVGLVPMLWARGTGAEIMRPMAAPVLGGILVADEVIDLFIPVIFHWHRVHVWRKMQRRKALAAGQPTEAQHV